MNKLNEEAKGEAQTLSDALLVGIANGTIDIVDLANRELADRGLNIHGNWVGFVAAKELYNARK